MESMQAEPNIQIQDKSQETHNSAMKLQKTGFEVSESKDHQQQQPQQQQRQQQQQLQQKGDNESKNEEQMITEECENGEEVENMEKKESDRKMEKVRENGGVLGPRDRLKKHRREVAGQVWIPDMWGHESFLKDWVDCTAFDASLMPKGLMLARASLMEDARRANSSNPLSLRLERSSC